MRFYRQAILNRHWSLFVCIIILISVSACAVPKLLNGQATPVFKVEIDKNRKAAPGHYSMIVIRLRSYQDRISGFSFLIAFDSTILQFRTAEPGGFLRGHGWADFSAEPVVVDPGNSDPNLCFYRITGSIGEGVPPDTAQESSDDLVRLTLHIDRDRAQICWFYPVRFFWRTCDDNIIFARPGPPYYARCVIDSKIPWEEWNDLPRNCFLDAGKTAPIPAPCRVLNHPSWQQAVVYANGGVEIVCIEGAAISGPGAR